MNGSPSPDANPTARLRHAWSRVRTQLALSYVLAGVVNLFLIFVLGLAVADLILGRGSARLVESQLEMLQRIGVSSAADLADEFVWRAASGRPSRREVDDRTAALHAWFPQSAAEVVCDGAPPAASPLARPSWLGVEDSVTLVTEDGRIDLFAYANRTYGDCHARVAVRRTLNSALSDTISHAIGLNVVAAGPVRLQIGQPLPKGSIRAGMAMAGAWWPVIVVAREWETGESQDWMVMRVQPDLMTVLRQIARRGQQQGAWVWMVALLTAAVLVIGSGSMFLAGRIAKRVISAINDLTEGSRRFGAGDLEHRIPERSGDQIGTLAKAFNRMASDVQRLIEETRQKERLEEEIRLGREVQEWLYPRQTPQLSGASVAVACQPARVVTGDVYDFVQSNGSVGILCADVSGKGVAAALLGASLYTILRQYVAYQLGRGKGAGFPCPSSVIRHADEELFKRVRSGQYATGFWCDFNGCTGAIRYTNAGHNAPILVTPSSPEPKRLKTGGIPIGLMPSASFAEEALQLGPGALLVAFTDGIVDACNGYAEEFGDERLVNLVMLHRDRPAEEVCRAVIGAARQWMCDSDQDDDMTVIALKVGEVGD